MIAQEAALSLRTANCDACRRITSRLNALLFEAGGDSAIFYETASRRSAPLCRGTVAILDIYEIGVKAKSQGQTSKVARFC